MKKFKFVPLALSVALVLSACTPGTKETITEDVKKNFSASALTVEEIKLKYGTESEATSGIMPMYNVERDEEFTFTFKFKSNDILASDMISVHTDSKALPESKILASVSPDYDINNPNTELTVSPIGSTLAIDRDYNGKSWGNAPIYYIRINYDLNADTPVKLDNPIIIPFTIKSEVEVPNLRYEISQDGNLKIVWDKVEGADSYNIYHVNSFGDLLKTDNVPLNGAEKGYVGQYPLLEENTTQTEWADFLNNGKDGLTEVNGLISGQNQGVNGEYYVTAVKGDKESNFSKAVSTASLSTQLPYELEENISFNTYDTVEDLPKTVQVKFIDGSVQNREVIYDTNVDFTNSETKIPFTIKGTAIKQYVVVKNIKKAEVDSLNTDGTTENSGYIEPENETKYVPEPTVPTIIAENKSNAENSNKDDADVDTDTGENADVEDNTTSEAPKDDIVAEQQANTEAHIEEGNKEMVEAPEVVKTIPINANSALEEYLALKMLEGESEISLKAFPEAQNFEKIQDVFLAVSFQNPLIPGIKSYGYDYSSLTLIVDYNETKETIKKEQEEIVKEAHRIIKATIKDGMTDDEKRKVLYDYLNDETKYDDGALENAEKNNFQMVDESFNDSFTTYGIMVKKVGVCQSYALTYKLLLDLVGVENVVVTGYLSGTPHAWNKVKIDGEWLHADSTNNETNAGVPYMYYQTNDETAEENNLVTDNEFWIDSEISQFDGTTNKHDYYIINGLEATNASEVTKIMINSLKENKTSGVVRLAEPNMLPDDVLMRSLADAINQVAPDKLSTAQLYQLGLYYIVELN